MKEPPGVRVWILATLLVGLAVRIIGWMTLKGALFCGIPAFDDAVHRVRAFQIHHGGFPEADLPWGSPLYPYAVSLVSSLVGDEVARILLVQVVMGLATAVLLAWALSPVLSRRGRWIAAFLYAVNPIGVFMEMRLQPVALCVALLLVGLRLIFYGSHRRAGKSGLGGLVLGLGALLQPLIFLALAVAGIWIRLKPSKGGPGENQVLGPAWRPALLLAIGFLLLPALLCGYHATLEGGGPACNWSGAVGFHRSLQPETWGTARSTAGPAWMDPGKARSVANEAAGRELNKWEITAFYRGAGVRLLAERPLGFIRSVLLRAMLLLSGREIPDPVSPSHVLRTNAPALSWGLYLFPPLLALGAIGLWRLRGDRRLGLLIAPLLAIGLANLLGTHSCATRWFFVIALLPASALGLKVLPAAALAALGRGGPRYLLPAALALLILSALDLPGARSRFDNPSEDLRYEAALLLKAQDRRGAIGRLRQAMREDAGNSMAYADLANLLMKEDLPAAARAEYENALRTDPRNEAALYGLSEMLRSQSMYAQAESTITRLLSLHPNHPLYLNQLGAIAMLQGKFDLARAVLRRALEISPNYQVAIMNLRAVEGAERQASALAFPEEMVPPPESELLQLGRDALLSLRQGNRSAADSLTRVGLEKHPEDLIAIYLRGAFLLEVGCPEESAGLLTRVVRAAPGRIITTQLATRALLASGKSQQALELVQWSLAKAADERNRQKLEEFSHQVERGEVR